MSEISGRIVVVLPAYNEEENLAPLFEQIEQVMASMDCKYEVIVVDDGSSDGTVSVSKEFAQRMPVHLEIHEQNQGLGTTIRDGLRVATQRAAEGDVIISLDADNTHPPLIMKQMMRKIREGADVVIASRYQKGATITGLAWHRIVMSIGVRVLMQVVFPMKGVRDYSCGYRAYRQPVLAEAFEHYGEKFIDQEGFQAMSDILLRLRRFKLRYEEVPLTLRYDLKGGVSKMNVGKTAVRTLTLMVKRRFGG